MELFDIQAYDFDKQKDILDIGDVYKRLNTLSVNRVAGIYELGLSISWTFNRTTSSVFLRFSTDGGVTWEEFEAEPKDATDSNATYYAFPKAHLGGTIGIIVEARKETSAKVFNVQFSDVWVDRKG